jgi:hypothetical protein
MFEYFAKIVPCWYYRRNINYGNMLIEVFWKIDEDEKEVLIIKAKPVVDARLLAAEINCFRIFK